MLLMTCFIIDELQYLRDGRGAQRPFQVASNAQGQYSFRSFEKLRKENTDGTRMLTKVNYISFDWGRRGGSVL